MRFLIAAVTASISIAAAGAAEQWQTFRDPAGVFSADFPDKPSISKSLGSNKDGHVVPPGVRYTALEGDIALVVTDTDLSNTPIEPENAIAGAVKSFGKSGTVLSDSNVTLGGHQGRTIAVAEETTTSMEQVFSVNGHLYQAIVIGPKTATPAQQAVIDKFMHSFQLK